MWDGLRQDIGFGARMLRRQPGFTAVALLALALGIGANTAIFSIVDAVLWRPLPYPSSERRDLARRAAAAREPRSTGRSRRPTSTTGAATTARSPAMAAIEPGPVNISGAGEPERVRAITVTAGFLDVLGVKPALGRDFTRDDETPDAPRRPAVGRILAAAIRRRAVRRRPDDLVGRRSVRHRRRAAGPVLLVADDARRRADLRRSSERRPEPGPAFDGGRSAG